MKPAVSTLTISFEAPFWVGLYEREEEGLYQVCKIPFGAEPKDYEVYAFLQRHWKDLTFSPPLPAGTVPRARINPKRLQREIRKQLQTPAIGTKAQQALQLQHAQRVQTRKETARQKRSPPPLTPRAPLRPPPGGVRPPGRGGPPVSPNEHGPAGEQRGCSKASPFASSEY